MGGGFKNRKTVIWGWGILFASSEYHYRYLKGPYLHNSSIHSLDLAFYLVKPAFIKNLPFYSIFKSTKYEKNFRVLYPSGFCFLGICLSVVRDHGIQNFIQPYTLPYIILCFFLFLYNFSNLTCSPPLLTWVF